MTFAAKFTPTMLYYTDQGKGEPLVLIHAFPTDSRLWEAQKELQDYFRVISVDLRGFGQSSATSDEAITMTSHARDIKLLLDTLHIKHAIIAGESMGGYVALAFLKEFPDNVSGLILSDSQTVADDEQTKAKRETLARDILKNGSTKFVTDFVTKALSSEALPQTRDNLLMIANSQQNNALASALRGMALREDTSDVLNKTNVSVLIITGENDQIINPKQSDIMHQLAKNSELVILPLTGHLSNLESSQQWNQAVINHFATKLS